MKWELQRFQIDFEEVSLKDQKLEAYRVYDTHSLLRIFSLKMRSGNNSLLAKYDPSPVSVLPWAKNGFYIFKWLRKKKSKEEEYFVMCANYIKFRFWKNQSLMPINNILLEFSHAHTLHTACGYFFRYNNKIE